MEVGLGRAGSKVDTWAQSILPGPGPGLRSLVREVGEGAVASAKMPSQMPTNLNMRPVFLKGGWPMFDILSIPSL